MNRPLLILDLDETLIFGSESPLEIEPDFRCGEIFIHKRPFVDEFIPSCAKSYNLAVWTSSTADYAECIREYLFPHTPLQFMWARERCTRRLDFETQEHYWVKDLKKVKRAGYDLSRVLMIDDTPQKLERNFGNLVVVSEYSGDLADRELVHLREYLLRLADENDFRKIEKRGWRSGQ